MGAARRHRLRSAGNDIVRVAACDLLHSELLRRRLIWYMLFSIRFAEIQLIFNDNKVSFSHLSPRGFGCTGERLALVDAQQVRKA